MHDPLTAVSWQLAAAHLAGDDHGITVILDGLDVAQLRTLVAAQAAALAALTAATATGRPATTALADPHTAAQLLSAVRAVLAEHALHHHDRPGSTRDPDPTTGDPQP